MSLLRYRHKYNVPGVFVGGQNRLAAEAAAGPVVRRDEQRSGRPVENARSHQNASGNFSGPTRRITLPCRS